MSASVLQSFILAAVVYATMFNRPGPPRLAATTSGESGDRSTSATHENASTTPQHPRPPLPVDPEADASTTPQHPRRPLPIDPEADASTTPQRPHHPLPADPEVDASTTPRYPRLANLEVDTTTSPCYPRRPLPVNSEAIAGSSLGHTDHGRSQVGDDSGAVLGVTQTMKLVDPVRHSGSDAQRRAPAPVFSSTNDQGIFPLHTVSQPSASVQPVTPVRARFVPADNFYPPQAPLSPTPTQHSLVSSGREVPQSAVFLTVFGSASWSSDSASRPALIAPTAGSAALVGVQRPPMLIESGSLAPTIPAAESASGHRSVGTQIVPRVRVRAAAKNRKATPRSISAPITRSVSGVPAVPSTSSASGYGGALQLGSTPLPSGRVAAPLTNASQIDSHERVPNHVAGPELVFKRHFRTFKGMAGVLNELGDPIRTHWFASESRFSIILLPPFSATPGVQLDDIYQHHTPLGDQLWVCGTAASGLWYWKPIQEGTRRADGRKLTITKTCKEPSWVL